jgi:hypothetical protein
MEAWVGNICGNAYIQYKYTFVWKNEDRDQVIKGSKIGI